MIFEKPGPRITRSNIAKLESELGLRFPTEYVAFLLERNGGKPIPSFFVNPAWPGTTRIEANWIDGFFRVSLHKRVKNFGGVFNPKTKVWDFWDERPSVSKEEARSIWWNTKKFSTALPRAAVVIGDCAMGTEYLFMRTTGAGAGSVWLVDFQRWTHEAPSNAFVKVAGSLNALLKKLVPVEEADALAERRQNRRAKK
jgi:hypothetical protein